MTKKEFLKSLSDKLSILSKEERDDILLEYENTIDEKIKNGVKEKQAVADFGSVDKLSKEVLKAYKINSDYTDNSVKTNFERGIKSLANSLSKGTTNLIDKFTATNGSLTLSLVFELIIKLLLFLIIAAIIKIPCLLLNDIGCGILSNITELAILQYAWHFIVFVLYLILVIMVAISIFKPYFSENQKKIKKKTPKSKNISNEEKIKEQDSNYFSKILLLILRIILFFIVIIPFGFIDLMCLFGLVMSIVYWIKGLYLFGLVLILMGLSLLFIYLTIVLFYIIFTNKKPYIWPFIVSFVVLVIGGIIFTNAVTNIEYNDQAPIKNISTDDYSYNITTPTYFSTYNGEVNKITDDSLSDGIVTVTVKYYKKYVQINENKYDVTDENTSDETVGSHIEFQPVNMDEVGNFDKNYNLVMKNLKNNKFYNYSKLYEINIIIKANSNTMQNIK